MRGMDTTLTALVRARTKLGDVEPMLSKALILVFQTVQRKFQTGGADDGSFWAPLKPETVRRKERLGGTAKPLIGAGPNAGALRQQWDFDINGKVATLRSRVDYGGFHEWGTRFLPVRQISPQEFRLREIGDRVGLDFATEVTA